MKPLKYKCSSCGKPLQYRGYCSTCQAEYKRRARLTGQLVACGVGYMPSDDIPRKDYEDFMGTEWSHWQLQSDLSAGVIPPGMILRYDGKSVVVHGGYGTHQWLMPYMGKVKLC